MLLIGNCSSATIPNSDSLKKPWRINKEQFIDKFGNSDTSKAFINFWFSNRKIGVATTAITTPFAGLVGIHFFKMVSKNPVNPGAYAPVLSFSFGLLFSILFLLSLAGFLKIIRFSRKKLYNLLVAYQSGQGLPERIRKKSERFLSRKY